MGTSETFKGGLSCCHPSSRLTEYNFKWLGGGGGKRGGNQSPNDELTRGVRRDACLVKFEKYGLYEPGILLPFYSKEEQKALFSYENPFG